MLVSCRDHYDALIDEGNDPVYDPQPLRDYMDKWDGQAFIERLELDKNASVLEIGVGTGRLAKRIAPLCGAFYGIDISPKTINRGKENLAAYSHVNLWLGDFLSFNFSRTFDIIYSSLTFMHIKRKQQAIRIIAQLLNPGGRCVLSISKSNESAISTGRRMVKIYPDTPKELCDYATTAGLQTQEQTETEFAYILVFTKPVKV
ncbi:MAG: methyltransferase domain-containing protein [Clostridia bacterium]|nr:methyltransferase domain-containing protein [Clostridia bacterium]